MNKPMLIIDSITVNEAWINKAIVFYLTHELGYKNTNDCMITDVTDENLYKIDLLERD